MKKELENKTNKNERKLSDEELNNVSGGSGCDSNERYSNAHKGSPNSVTFVAQVGEEIEYKHNGNRTKALVIATKIEDNRLHNTQDGSIYYYDKYKIRDLDGSNNEGWISRRDIYKK